MNPPHSIINPIVNRNFGNKFHHQNGPNKRQHTNKNASHKYHNITTRQQYQNRNNGQQHKHRNPSEQYQTISLQRHRTSSITYLKEHCLGCGINNKGVIELIMQHYGTLENCPFRVPLYIREKSPKEQLLQNNHKHGSSPKDSNKNKYKSKNT